MNTTIVDRLREHARSKPNSTAFRFLNDLEQVQELSYVQLLDEAQALAYFLVATAAPGSRVMLFFPPGLTYIKAFYACLLAGMVAVPLYPPRRNVKSDRIINVAQSCQADIALTTESELATVQAAWTEQNTKGLALKFFATDCIPALDVGTSGVLPKAELTAPAFLQYTSGSTGVPKGVIVTHANIVANCQHLVAISETTDKDVFVNWAPAFHDLGLVTAVLWPVMLGAQSVLMAPASFVRNPVLWFKAISRYRGTMCGGPNFAFDLCADKINDADLVGLDLSSWRIAYVSAEPVRADTMAKFNQRFNAFGFKPEAFFPCYGMAEATLVITGGGWNCLPVVLTVDKHAIADMRVNPVPDGDPDGVCIVGCGQTPAPHDVRVVDPQTYQEKADGQVGEIWFSGASVSPGYWGLTELTKDTFEQVIVGREDDGHRYLRTGDLGVQVDGNMFIVGRIKDLIIVRGRNYYPQDIEATVGSAHHAVRRGSVAAFSVDASGSEQIVVVAELEREHFRHADTEQVIAAIRQSVARDHEIALARVVLLKPYKIPMTSSGKIQRRQTRCMLAEGTLETLAQSDQIAARLLLAARTQTEATLVQIWRKVLKRTAIGVDENFFEIGGDSLDAVEIAAQMETQFLPVKFDASHMLDRPTIETLACWIDLRLAHLAAKTPNTAKLKTISI